MSEMSLCKWYGKLEYNYKSWNICGEMVVKILFSTKFTPFLMSVLQIIR